MRSARPPLALLVALLPLLPVLARPASAQATGKPASASAGGPAGLTLDEVNDRRSRSVARLLLTLVASDLKDSDVRGKRIVVRKAVDDTGASLVPAGADEATFELNLGALSERSRKTPAGFLVRLESPSRAAKSLTVVSGQVEIYVPGRDPASTVTIQRYLSTDGRPLADPALSSNGVKVTVLGPKGFAAERKAAGEAARKKAREEGLGEYEVEQRGESAERLMPGFDPKLHTLLKVDDPHDRIGSFGHVDPQGKEAPAWSEIDSGYALLTHPADERGTEWGLRIHLKTPKSMVVRTFALKDVPLP